MAETFPSELEVKYLQTTNPDYSLFDCMLAEAMYQGGKLFDKFKRQLIYKRQADKNKTYLDSRLDRAEYTNWVAGVFDNYVSTAFTCPPQFVFDGPVGVLPYYNTLNKDLRKVSMGRARDILNHGYGVFTVSFPSQDPTLPNFGMQKQIGELSPTICYVHPTQIVDWRLDELGKLIWLKTLTMDETRSTEFGPCDQELYTWSYYTDSLKVSYQATKKKDQVDFDNLAMAKRVALVPYTTGLPFFECSLADRLCIFERVKRLAISLFNSEADYNFALAANCYPQPWYAGPNQTNSIATSMNEWTLWSLGTGGTVGYLQPDGVPFEALDKVCERKRSAFFTTMNSEALNMGDKDQHAASGDAKAHDRLPAEASASMLALALRETLCELMDYIIACRNEVGIVTYKLIGLDTFNPLSLASKIANTTAFIPLPASETAKRLNLVDLAQSMAPHASPEEREQIISEQMEMDIKPPAPIVAPPPDPSTKQDDAPPDDSPSAPSR